jgi:hypothetical protein
MWETNTCFSGPAPVTAQTEDALPAGREWQGIAAAFKQQVLTESGMTGGTSTVGYFATPMPDGVQVGCPAISMMRPFQPGQVEEEAVVWDVVPPQGLAIRTGELTIKSTFESVSLSASASVVVEGAAAAQFTVVDYVDAALSVPKFREWLESQPRTTWVNTAVAFWPSPEGAMPPRQPYRSAPNGAVDIGLFTSPPGTNGYGAVILDPVTLEVLGTRFE